MVFRKSIFQSIILDAKFRFHFSKSTLLVEEVGDIKN